ncbi:MAG TPA: insulinase family protein [Sphingomicrobium sp.]|nr:insulinase family protein [Sphingomicrobium sp.]
MRSIIALVLLASTSALPLQGASAQPAASAAASQVDGWGRTLTDVPADPAVTYGRLPNGMKYAIRANSTPKGTASIRLYLDVGSIAESERERGLAHFIEHMAFNGTTHVPEGEMMKILERQGLAFGPDTNAMTSFESTIYMLELPKVDEQRLDTAFFLLREVASEVKFDPEAVDRERGVILSEKRSRENFQLRRIVKNLEFHMPEARFANRLPIGTEDVLKSATAGDLADLYRRYYRPENATLVIVGDVDPKQVEAKLRAKFADWTGKGQAGAEPDKGRVDFSRAADFASFTDPAIETSAMITVERPWDDSADTLTQRRVVTIRQIGLALLSRRLDKIANAPGSKIIDAAAQEAPGRDLAWSATVSAVAKDGEWQAGLTTIEQELRRAVRHGFNQSELNVQLADIDGSLENAAQRANTRSSPALAQSILGIIDDNDFITEPQFRLDFFRKIKPTITVAEVNAEFRKLWTGSQPLVFVTDKKAVAKTALAQAFDASRKVAVLPMKDNGAVKFAYDSFGPAGKIVADLRIDDLGIRTLRFANNVRLNIKKTDFEKGSIRYSVRLAGGQLALPANKPGLAAMVSMLSPIGALEKHSAEDLKQILAGHNIQIGFAVSEDAIVTGGTSSPRDFALQMKMSAAFLTHPGYRKEAETRWESLVPVIEAQARATPQSVAQMKLPAVLANDDPRFGFPDEVVLKQRKLDEAKALLAPLLASAPIEIAVVGDVDEAAVIDAVGRTFGALPARELEAPAYSEARKVSFRKALAPVTLTHSGDADQALLAIAWPTDDDDDLERVVGLNLLADVLKLELTDTLREKLGASYSPAASSFASDVFDDFGYVMAATTLAPDKIDEVEKAVASLVGQLQSAPVSDDLLARARNPVLERIDRQERENGYWLALADEAQTDPDRLERHRKRKAAYTSITPEELQRLARQYLSADKTLIVKVVSDKLGKPVQTAAAPGAKTKVARP